MCYPIHWFEQSSNALDWECHATREAAEFSAQELVRHNETYLIEEYDHALGAEVDMDA